MKLSVICLLVLEAIPVAITANPLGVPHQQQQALAVSPPSTPSSLVDSWSTASALESNSDRPSRKFSFSNPLKKLKQSSDFRCHSYPQSNILSELSSYITDLLRSYRESILGGKGEQERMLFETCYAGYEVTDVSPTIYFKEMKSKQMNTVEKLLKNQVLTRFPNVKIVATSKSLAIMLEEQPKLQRRNTV